MTTQAGISSRLGIELDGDLGGAEALSLAERLPLSEMSEAKHVVLSLRKVGRIDEAGLAMLVRLYSHLRVRGGTLELIDVPELVAEMLQRVGFSRLVSQEESARLEQVHYSIALGRQVQA